MDDLERVLDKIEAGLPAKTINHLERIARTVFPLQRPNRSYQSHSPVLSRLRQALLLQRSMILHHRKPDQDETVEHRVDPYLLLLYQHGLYLVGHSHRAQALRMFAVERIKDVTVLDERFEVRPTFRIEDFGHRLFGLIEEEPEEVRIEFSREVAYLLKERAWHPTQEIRPLQNGNLLVSFKAGGQDEIASWVLSWGPYAKVLSPASLAQTVRRRLAAALKQYQSS